MPFIDPEVMIGLGGFIGAATGVYAGIKKWPFWKNYKDDRQNEDIKLKTLDHCQVPACHDLVVETSTEVKELKAGQVEIFERINELPNDFIKVLKDAKELFRS
jgi:hypothetical protein